MNKGIWAGLVAIAFVAGSITTGTIAYAAPGGVSGNPIASLQAQLDAFGLQLDAFRLQLGTFETTFLDRLASVELRIPVLQQQIDDEEAARLAADSALQSALDAEVARAVVAESQLQSNIGAEAAARATADDLLQQQIDQASGTPEESDPQVAILLGGKWCRSDGAVVNCDVEPFDFSLVQANIAAEAAARLAADNQLQANIDAEAAARAAADGNFARLDIPNNFIGPQRFGSTVDVASDARIGNRMDVTGPTNLRSTLEVTGPGVFRNTLNVQGASTFASNVDVAGPVTSANSMTAPTVRGANQLCIGGDCRSAWPAGGSSTITTYIVRGSTDCPPSSFCFAQANCNSGDVALGGGFTSIQSRFFQVYFNAPLGLPEAFGWGVEVFSTHTDTRILTATAVCLDRP